MKRALSKVVAVWVLVCCSNLLGQPAQVTLDIRSEPGASISPYIYGQFIEHLGRCIRDGIWSEKLRDRKFLLEPSKSPWQAIKAGESSFEMFHDSAGAYAGDHCMALWLRDAKGGACGIRQGDIGLVAGKEYVGYAILACPTRNVGGVQVRLAWGQGASESQTVVIGDVRSTYKKFPFRFRAGATTDAASLSLLISDPAYLWVAGVSLMPADNIKGMRADTLELIRKINSPITRWPGGNFVSGYNWKDGIGDRDRRPPRWERAWNDVEDNDFGVDEFMEFCQQVRTEPYIAVNTGLGSVQEALDELEYVTGSAKTRWGAERARNGHSKPYAVSWWGVGNEMFGDWQLGNVPVERYTTRHNAFASAMKARNPAIKLIAVGSPGRWNDLVFPACAANMDLLSGHHYAQRKFKAPFSTQEAQQFERDFAGYSDEVARGIRDIVGDFRKRLGKGPEFNNVRLAIDEWGIVRDWNPAPDGPGIGSFEHYYTLGDAIASAKALHELIRSADVVAMGNWAQTVNVIGAIKTSRNYAVLDPVGHLLALYRAEVGGKVLRMEVTGESRLDAVAASGTKNICIGLVNASATQDVCAAITLDGKATPLRAKGWRIEGPSLGAINIPGQAEVVLTKSLTAVTLDKPLSLPAHSITVLAIEP